MENNRVKVKIYGQYYTIAGNHEEEFIMRVATYVDEKMKELGRNFSAGSQGAGTIAVLTALNIADEHLTLMDSIQGLREDKEQMEKERGHYMHMWDEAKKSYAHYKESAAKFSEEREVKEKKIRELEEKCKELENTFYDLQMENLKLKGALRKYMESDEF